MATTYAEVRAKRAECLELITAYENATPAAKESKARALKAANLELDRLVTDYDKNNGRQIDPTDENPRRGVDSDGGGPGTIKAIKSTDKFAESNGGASSVSLDGYLRAALTGEWDRLPAELFYGSNMKAMATDALGSLTLPSTLTNRVIDLARSKSRVIQAGAITARMNGPQETISRVTGAPSPAWKTENALIAAGDLVFEPVNLVARTLAARAIMSVELSDDVPTIGDALEAELTAAMAGELDRAALLGSGTPPEPRGLLNTSGVTVQDVSFGLAGGYADFSRAVQHIREAEGEPNAVILGPDVLGELERLTDMDGNPLVAPDSYRDLTKLTTTRLAEKAVVGDWSKFLVAIRQELRIEATRQANDENGLGFSSYSVLIRATLRADFAVLRPSHFEVLTTFATGS